MKFKFKNLLILGALLLFRMGVNALHINPESRLVNLHHSHGATYNSEVDHGLLVWKHHQSKTS